MWSRLKLSTMPRRKSGKPENRNSFLCSKHFTTLNSISTRVNRKFSKSILFGIWHRMYGRSAIVAVPNKIATQKYTLIVLIVQVSLNVGSSCYAHCFCIHKNAEQIQNGVKSLFSKQTSTTHNKTQRIAQVVTWKYFILQLNLCIGRANIFQHVKWKRHNNSMLFVPFNDRMEVFECKYNLHSQQSLNDIAWHGMEWDIVFSNNSEFVASTRKTFKIKHWTTVCNTRERVHRTQDTSTHKLNEIHICISCQHLSHLHSK